MSPSVTWNPESEKSPIGKAWNEYWREKTEGVSKRAVKLIHRDKEAARRRMHRKLRRDKKRELKEICRSTNRRVA